MPASLLTLNSVVPPVEHPGTPAIVIYDNGDWEIAHDGDVDYIAEGSSNFFATVHFVEFFIDLMIYFDIGDRDDLDVSGDRVILFIEETVTAGALDEPVMLIWSDTETDVMDRAEAEGIIASDTNAALNFIPVLDLFADYCEWRGGLDDESLWGDEMH